MNRRTSAAVAVSASLVTVITGVTTGHATTTPNVLTEHPNVVLILLDDARTDDMYAMQQVVDRVGGNGITMTNNYSPFPLCSPSRSTLLTGRYPHNTKVLGNSAPRGGYSAFDPTSTLVTWLDPTYTTILVGKYLNGEPVNKGPVTRPPGWDEFDVSRDTYNYTEADWSLDRGDGGVDTTIEGYEPDTVGDLAVDAVHRYPGVPKFLYVAGLAPHVGGPGDPDDPPFPFTTPYVKPADRGMFPNAHDTDPAFNEPNVDDKPVQLPLLTDQQISYEQQVTEQRDESLLAAQNATLRIMDALQAEGELDNTIFVVTSDNGYLTGDHRVLNGKVLGYQPSNRMPLMISGPGIPAGTRSHQLVDQADFAPTILAATNSVGANGATPMDGVNLWPLLQHPDTTTLTRTAIPLEGSVGTGTGPPYLYHGVRSGVWKYLHYTDGRGDELYNEKMDPHELVNVAARPGYQQTTTQAAAQTRMEALLTQVEWCKGAACR